MSHHAPLWISCFLSCSAVSHVPSCFTVGAMFPIMLYCRCHTSHHALLWLPHFPSCSTVGATLPIMLYCGCHTSHHAVLLVSHFPSCSTCGGRFPTKLQPHVFHPKSCVISKTSMVTTGALCPIMHHFCVPFPIMQHCRCRCHTSRSVCVHATIPGFEATLIYGLFTKLVSVSLSYKIML